MQVELTRFWNSDRGVCVVTREPGDPVFRNGGWGDAESQLLYHVKKELLRQDFDVIKKRMWKDGHLVDETQQYIVTRKGFRPSFWVYDNNYAIRNMAEDFNRDGKIELAAEWEIWWS